MNRTRCSAPVVAVAVIASYAAAIAAAYAIVAYLCDRLRG